MVHAVLISNTEICIYIWSGCDVFYNCRCIVFISVVSVITSYKNNFTPL